MAGDDLDRELRTHLDQEAEERRERGVSPEEARYAALRAFGNPTLVKEEIHEMSPWLLLEQLGQDVRYALRTLRRNAAFTIVAILSLALGIGGNTAVFSLVSGVLLRSLPYAESERLVQVTGFYPQGALVHCRSGPDLGGRRLHRGLHVQPHRPRRGPPAPRQLGLREPVHPARGGPRSAGPSSPGRTDPGSTGSSSSAIRSGRAHSAPIPG